MDPRDDIFAELIPVLQPRTDQQLPRTDFISMAETRRKVASDGEPEVPPITEVRSNSPIGENFPPPPRPLSKADVEAVVRELLFQSFGSLTTALKTALNSVSDRLAKVETVQTDLGRQVTKIAEKQSKDIETLNSCAKQLDSGVHELSREVQKVLEKQNDHEVMYRENMEKRTKKEKGLKNKKKKLLAKKQVVAIENDVEDEEEEEEEDEEKDPRVPIATTQKIMAQLPKPVLAKAHSVENVSPEKSIVWAQVPYSTTEAPPNSVQPVTYVAPAQQMTLTPARLLPQPQPAPPPAQPQPQPQILTPPQPPPQQPIQPQQQPAPPPQLQPPIQPPQPQPGRPAQLTYLAPVAMQAPPTQPQPYQSIPSNVPTSETHLPSGQFTPQAPPPQQEYKSQPQPYNYTYVRPAEENGQISLPAPKTQAVYPAISPQPATFNLFQSQPPQPNPPGFTRFPQPPSFRPLQPSKFTPPPPIQPPEPTNPQPPDSGHTSTHNIPMEQVINDVTNMGFDRFKVRSVVTQLLDRGESVDLNAIIDRLMSSGY